MAAGIRKPVSAYKRTIEASINEEDEGSPAKQARLVEDVEFVNEDVEAIISCATDGAEVQAAKYASTAVYADTEDKS